MAEKAVVDLLERQPQPPGAIPRSGRLAFLREFSINALILDPYGKGLEFFQHRQPRMPAIVFMVQKERVVGRARLGTGAKIELPRSTSRTTDLSVTPCLDGERTAAEAACNTPRLTEIARIVPNCWDESI